MLSEGETYWVVLSKVSGSHYKENKCFVRLLLRHLGLEHLTMILHALDLLDRSLLLHGSVNVLVGENLGRHD